MISLPPKNRKFCHMRWADDKYQTFQEDLQQHCIPVKWQQLWLITQNTSLRSRLPPVNIKKNQN